ncbi:hypothetical protein ACGFZP_05135 [Kitasatospora sp. NPDC048239]|uniref:hypothetical protein n=1 Tax=Kitasatospora sp. NPDC048239 TaxID=3364046 RepID=UPI00371EE203
MAAETIHVRGEGGTVIAMDLPLPEAIAQRLAKGQLQRVTEDGSPYTAPPPDDVPSLPAKAPAKAAPRDAWVGWAVACGADPDQADGMTKADLVDAYAELTPREPAPSE